MSDRRVALTHRSLRARATFAALGVFALALALGAPALYLDVQRVDLGGLDASLALTVGSVGDLVRQGALPQALRPSSAETSFVQVVNQKNVVVAQSANESGQGPLVSMASPPNSLRYRTFAHLAVGGEVPYRVAVLRIRTSSGLFAVYAGSSMAATNSSLSALLIALGIGGPLALVVAGLLTWLVLARALAPLDKLRHDVSEISNAKGTTRFDVGHRDDEISRLASTMNDMFARLEHADQSMRTFVADASHELNSPVAAAQLELEVALIHRDSSRWPDVANAVLSDVERIRRIVDDLATLSSFDEAKPSQFGDVDLDEVVLRECTRLERLSPVRLIHRDVSGARVHGERELLARAVRNLLDNALVHATSVVTVSLIQHEHEVVLRVRDDGAGIAPEDRERIFERFVRLDPSRTHTHGGSGLGLAIVREIVLAHHGQVDVGPGPGAEFIVTLARGPWNDGDSQ